MKYLTFLDYSILEATGKNIESKLVEKDEQIKSIKAKYDEDIALLKDAVTDMQMLLKNPEKLVDLIGESSSLDFFIHSFNNFLPFFIQKIF